MVAKTSSLQQQDVKSKDVEPIDSSVESNAPETQSEDVVVSESVAIISDADVQKQTEFDLYLSKNENNVLCTRQFVASGYLIKVNVPEDINVENLIELLNNIEWKKVSRPEDVSKYLKSIVSRFYKAITIKSIFIA